MSIELTHCSKEHLPVLKGFELPEEQRRFTALPRDVMQAGDGQYPIVIVSEGTPVGFFFASFNRKSQRLFNEPERHAVNRVIH